MFQALIAISLFAVILRSAGFYAFALFSASKFHKNMLDSVMLAKIRFFDLNPIGRIMNRFSKDIGNIDEVLPLALFDLIEVIN